MTFNFFFPEFLFWKFEVFILMYEDEAEDKKEEDGRR